ncbi:MAG: hypothetical protein RIC55_04365 [Pirellulaceae bacterium]
MQSKPKLSKSSAAPAASESGGMAGPIARAVASLLIFIHFFCVFVAMSANFNRSPLQVRVADTLSIYTEPLNLELLAVPYHLTHADEPDVDHRLEILPQGKDPADSANWIVLPAGGVHGSDSSRRYQQIAATLATFGTSPVPSDEAISARLAQSVAENLLHQQGITPQRIRSRRHALQAPENIASGDPRQMDPWDEQVYFRTPYEANLIVNDDGTISVVKVDPEGEVARPVAPAGPAPPAGTP